MQEIIDIYFDAGFSIDVILVLESLEDSWKRIYKISSELVQSLPGRIMGLYFMGKADRYPISTYRDFNDKAPGWFKDNINRVSLINPIFEALERDGFDGAIVVICAGRIIDINDWDDTDILSRTLVARITDEYLFSWNDIPGNNGRLIEFLKQNFGVDWVKTAKIEKIDDGKAIEVSYEKNYISLKLNNEKTEAYLKIDNGATEKFMAKMENEKLNIYARITDEPFQHKSDNMKTVDIKSRTESDLIKKNLENPIVEVCIKGKGFVPLCCSINGKVEAIYKNGNFKLKITTEEERLKLHLKAVGIEPPLFNIKRIKGNVKVIKGKKENSCFEPMWKEIPENLKPLVKAGISRNEYVCPQCNKNHRWDVLICPQGDIILKGFPLNTCTLFTKERYLSLTDYYGYPLRSNQRIITREGNLYEWKDDKWERLNIPILYTEIDDEMWGLYHRI